MGGPRKSKKGSLWSGPTDRNEAKDAAKAVKKHAKKAVKKHAKKAQRRAGKKVMNLGDAIGRAVSQQRAKEKTVYAKVQDVIKTYGKDQAHTQLGVSKKTVQGWMNPDKSKRKKPSAESQRKIDQTHNNPAVREATLAKRKADAASSRGAAIKVTGMIAPGGDRDYLRHRTIDTSVPPEAAEDILAAWQSGGNDEAQRAVSDAFVQHYFGGQDHIHSVLMEDLTTFEFSPMTWQGDGGVEDW